MVIIPHSSFYRRAQPDLSAYVQASLAAVDGTPDPETGHFGELHYAGCETKERATEIKQALFRAARYLKVSMSAQIVADKDGSFRVIFKAIHKEYARRYVREKYGDNPPYRPGGNSYG